MEQDDPYVCVGVCMADPDSGYCLGCGRPPLGESTPSSTSAPSTDTTPTNNDLPASE